MFNFKKMLLIVLSLASISQLSATNVDRIWVGSYTATDGIVYKMVLMQLSTNHYYAFKITGSATEDYWLHILTFEYPSAGVNVYVDQAGSTLYHGPQPNVTGSADYDWKEVNNMHASKYNDAVTWP